MQHCDAESGGLGPVTRRWSSGFSRSAAAMKLRRQCIRIVVGLLIAAAGFPGIAGASADDWSAWIGVQKYQGQYDCERINDRQRSVDDQIENAYSADSASARFELHADPVKGNAVYGEAGQDNGQYVWSTARGIIYGSHTYSGSRSSTWDHVSFNDSGSFSGPVADLSFDIDPKTGEWTFTAGGELVKPYSISKSATIRRGKGGGVWETETRTDSTTSTSYAHAGFRGTLAAGKPGLISGSWNETRVNKGSDSTDHYNCRVRLTPVVPELELIVEIEGTKASGESTTYEKWLPEGAFIAEKEPAPGSRLQLKARLRNKDKSPLTAEVKQVRFELHETSREPSVALNWPPEASGGGPKIPPDPNFDLRFDGQTGKTDAKKQLQTVTTLLVSNGEPTAEAGIDCYDFGAWSTVVVVAELADGRTVTGHLEKDPDTWAIPLPKSTGASFIADAWKEQYKITAPDRSDDETEPEGEPGCSGDGLTLYEEYRGFYENGRHIRTNPKRKDLFIFNNCGAVAEPGIQLFQRVSKLEVHKKFRREERSEMHEQSAYGSWFDATINGYFDRGPHRILQHRVDIESCGNSSWGSGGQTVLKEHEAWWRHLRPKDVQNITVEGPGSDIWAKQYGVSAADKPRQFDIAIAHELFHAVGVDHHGQGDYSTQFTAMSADEPGNPTGHATWVASSVEKTPVRILEEMTGKDITESSAKRVLDLLWSDSPDKGERNRSRQIYFIGKKNAAHSGDEDCVMRYFFADAYQKKDNENAFYLVPDGTEPVGSQICTGTTGHSVNKAGRKPQPRYFDAAPTRGNCKHWVCVNDAIPGKSNRIPEGAK